MPFKEAINSNDPKRIDLVPDKTEVGTKEDLGKNVSWELAQSFKDVEEKNDAEPVVSQIEEKIEENTAEIQTEKSLEEVQAEVNFFREQIRIGEGRENEKMVLENESKLRVAEKMLINKQEERREEEKKNNEIAALRQEIQGYREQIKIGESRDNEKMVLENESKLREIEKKIITLNNSGPEKNKVTETEPAPEKVSPIEQTPEPTTAVEQAEVSSDSEEPVAEELTSEESMPEVSVTPETPTPITVIPETPKKKKGFFSKMFSFGRKEK